MNLENTYFSLTKSLHKAILNSFNTVLDTDLVSSTNECIKLFSEEIISLKELGAPDTFIEKWATQIMENIETIYHSPKLPNSSFDNYMELAFLPLFKTGTSFFKQYKSYLLPIQEKDALDKNLTAPKASIASNNQNKV